MMTVHVECGDCDNKKVSGQSEHDLSSNHDVAHSSAPFLLEFFFNILTCVCMCSLPGPNPQLEISVVSQNWSNCSLV